MRADFICEYCSCVLIPEEKSHASHESLDGRAEEHRRVLKLEQQKKAQLDDETLELARDVRVLRQRRKIADEESAQAHAHNRDK